jgi:hypothetical protein
MPSNSCLHITLLRKTTAGQNPFFYKLIIELDSCLHRSDGLMSTVSINAGCTGIISGFFVLRFYPHRLVAETGA